MPTRPEPMGEAAFHGIAGEFVRAVEEQTEADPAGLLVTFLAACGSAVGNSPSISISGTRHTARIWPVLVGSTASGRKGTTLPWVQQVIERADPSWRRCMASNVGSGEAVLWRVRDAVGIPGDGSLAGAHDLGAEEKRLFIMESEFVSVLQVAARAGSVLSPILRSAWDSDRLTHTVKHQPVTATGAHIVVVGHITPEELQRELRDGDRVNGFGNRFLYIHVQRSRVLPRGGEIGPGVLERLGDRLGRILAHGKLTDRLSYSDGFWAEYEPRYPGLSEPPPGIVGAMTGRGAPYVHRLALLFALLDNTRTIGGDHARAALAVWDYSRASAAYFFTDESRDQHRRIREVVAEAPPEGLGRSEIHYAVGGRTAAGDLDAARDRMVEEGRIVVERTTPGEKGGRPKELWRPLPSVPDDDAMGDAAAPLRLV